LQSLLGIVTNLTGVNYDLGEMYIGTVHSLCRRLMTDRHVRPDRQRVRPPHLLDDLDQYFHLGDNRFWPGLLDAAGLDSDSGNQAINAIFGDNSQSKHVAVSHCTAFFNRIAEEQIDPGQAVARLLVDHRVQDELAACQVDPAGLSTMLSLAVAYYERLRAEGVTTFALLQQHALDALQQAPNGRFRYIIIDEYQDTNAIQERLFFQLAQGHGNICVVGDDDQSLYRFRGATVENFVQFPQRCRDQLGVAPQRISLSTNYRSRSDIVDFYTRFIDHCDWRVEAGRDDFYRVVDKDIQAHRQDARPAVVATPAGEPMTVFSQIAALVRSLIDQGIVADPNQVAFLYPSLQYRGKMTDQVRRMKEALEGVGLQVYAPRAGRFLDGPEAVEVFGVLLHILGAPPRNGEIRGHDYDQFRDWLDRIGARGQELIDQDGFLAAFVSDRRQEIATTVTDYQTLLDVVERRGWSLDTPYDIDSMKRMLLAASGLSERAQRNIGSTYFERPVRRRAAEGNPYLLKAILNRAASLDWSLLDLLYRICGFAHFRAMFDLAEQGIDEGPVCNLGLISQYLARFQEGYVTILTAYNFQEHRLANRFFGSFLYALYRRGESEYEDAEDPFPRGRVSFLTIHQSKGLEFPVVVLANPRKDNRGPSVVERLVRPFVQRTGSEPLDRSTDFDIMRMFYVALSRAENLLVLGNLSGRGQRINKPFQRMLADGFPGPDDLELDAVPQAGLDQHDMAHPYSYTADYLAYKRCPRRYMVFRRYGFAPSRSETMLFGSLVHRTLEDLHNHLIALRSSQP
jgi:DNA helicase-2/ATP-dependent DNA helicase PcrA